MCADTGSSRTRVSRWALMAWSAASETRALTRVVAVHGGVLDVADGRLRLVHPSHILHETLEAPARRATKQQDRVPHQAPD